MLLLSTFIGKQVFAPPDLKTVYYIQKSYDFFFFLSATSKLNFTLITIFRISTFGVTRKQFFKTVMIFIYKMISNIVFFNSSSFVIKPRLKKLETKLFLKGTTKMSKTQST